METLESKVLYTNRDNQELRLDIRFLEDDNGNPCSTLTFKSDDKESFSLSDFNTLYHDLSMREIIFILLCNTFPDEFEEFTDTNDLLLSLGYPIFQLMLVHEEVQLFIVDGFILKIPLGYKIHKTERSNFMKSLMFNLVSIYERLEVSEDSLMNEFFQM